MNKCRVGKRHKNSRLWAVALGLLALAALCVSAAAQENTTDYWMDRANVLIHKDLEEEAVFAYDEVLKLDPKNETALLRKASTLYTLGKEDEGQRAYERALLLMEEDLKNTSQNAKAWQNKAIALSGLGRKDEAKEANEEALAIFNHSLDRDPENISLWKGKADVLAFLGRWEEALQAYSRVTEIDPEDYGAWGRKGEFLGMIGRYNESLLALDKAIETIPADNDEDLQAWNLAKVAVLHSSNQIGEALSLLDNLSDLYPQNKKAWSLMGYDMAKLGRYNESLEAYEEVLELDPKDAQAWSTKARQLVEMKRYDEAQEAFDKAIELMPGDDLKELEQIVQIWLDKGDAHNETDNGVDAGKAFQKALEISDEALLNDSEQTSFMLLKGNALFNLDRYDEARKAYDQAIKIASPNSFHVPSAWIGKGKALLALGRNEEALEAFRQALEINPTLVEAWKGKGDSQKALGRARDASLSFHVAEKLG